KKDVRICCRIGHDLFEDYGEQIFASQSLRDRILIRHGCQRVAVINEESLHRRILFIQKNPAEMIHVELARVPRLHFYEPRGIYARCVAVAECITAAAYAELAEQRRHREDGSGSLSAIA